MDFENILKQIVTLIDKYDGVVIGYILHFCFAIIIFIIGRIIAKFISRQLKRILTIRQVDPTVVKFVSALSYYAIIIMTLVAVLGQLGVQTASIVAVIGAAGLAVGLALQGSLSNFAAGVILIIFRPFKVGETVVINNQRGVIDSIQIFSTSIVTPTNEVVVIPNGQVVSANIINYSRLPERRLDLVINVGYNSDIQKVYQVLNQAVNQTSNILTTKKPIIRLDVLDASSMNFNVLVWTLNENYGALKAELLENIKNALTENNINIPYPTMDVNVTANH
ncbi:MULTISPECIES: mechanosensitive ion channel domain-containing protein [unclassified Gilliamella]|uniref:mechanosensitive ion channel domain-containing protein n=1 Tax=unclassified Gilliamella TaxID=2685620 RepID=UPI00226AF965|nr:MULTISPECIES: mechanosensitive ion channel domain-containing protein [unclassified Gilliamella]MCX8574372.1 mechanosensitive ion channel [Gilliamella sp. B3831]MCX8576603.1 mechanosensitive ion channel [Gilliamella sp. B3815]MCX8590827.1 mechanosensitive ion channel [Gilliamella sp. B3812]MCX8603510.1 mechanosensitive ion channel [Gilliamella sp. B3823]MCX8605902.1 mechanosensitive ion channel [Gilliamella sp. B3825]